VPRLVARFRSFLVRLRAIVARPFRREVAPGRYEAGSAGSWRGYVSTAPLVEPARDYLVYVPAGWTRRSRAALLVLLHGCRQAPEEIAALTRVAERADASGMIVLLPRQTSDANGWGCWNWFESNTERGAGEAAIVAAQIVAVRRRYRARRGRVVVAGMSAGGALAATLGLRYPRLVGTVLVHSGLACGAASTPANALRAMRDGPDGDVTRVADQAYIAQGRRSHDVRLLVVHGDADEVVAPANADALVRQYLRFNRLSQESGVGATDAGRVPPPFATARSATGGDRAFRIDDWHRGLRPVVRRVVVNGLGHAWSGGDGAYAYADPRGPDALDLLDAFVAASGPPSGIATTG
jgi:poly(3-hydroxybutyrate) depolymerase